MLDQHKPACCSSPTICWALTHELCSAHFLITERGSCCRYLFTRQCGPISHINSRVPGTLPFGNHITRVDRANAVTVNHLIPRRCKGSPLLSEASNLRAFFYWKATRYLTAIFKELPLLWVFTDLGGGGGSPCRQIIDVFLAPMKDAKPLSTKQDQRLTKWVFKLENQQIFGLKLYKYEWFSPARIVGRGSKT